MKSKQLSELKNFSQQELLSQLEKRQQRYFELSSKKKIAPPRNPLELRALRRDMARIKTIYSSKFNKNI